MAYQACLGGGGGLSAGEGENVEEEEGGVCQCRHGSRVILRLVGSFLLCVLLRGTNDMSDKSKGV